MSKPTNEELGFLLRILGTCLRFVLEGKLSPARVGRALQSIIDTRDPVFREPEDVLEMEVVELGSFEEADHLLGGEYLAVNLVGLGRKRIGLWDARKELFKAGFVPVQEEQLVAAVKVWEDVFTARGIGYLNAIGPGKPRAGTLRIDHRDYPAGIVEWTPRYLVSAKHLTYLFDLLQCWDREPELSAGDWFLVRRPGTYSDLEVTTNSIRGFCS